MLRRIGNCGITKTQPAFKVRDIGVSKEKKWSWRGDSNPNRLFLRRWRGVTWAALL
jgi:hypothetical protein